MVTQAPLERVERDSVRLAAVLILAGVLVTAIAGFLHPEGADANDHRTISLSMRRASHGRPCISVSSSE